MAFNTVEAKTWITLLHSATFSSQSSLKVDSLDMAE